jgi:hypothetical protein
MLYSEVALLDKLISRLAERMSLVPMTAFGPSPQVGIPLPIRHGKPSYSEPELS